MEGAEGVASSVKMLLEREGHGGDEERVGWGTGLAASRRI